MSYGDMNRSPMGPFTVAVLVGAAVFVGCVWFAGWQMGWWS